MKADNDGGAEEGKVDHSRNGHHGGEQAAEEGGPSTKAAAEEAEQKRKNARMLLTSGKVQSWGPCHFLLPSGTSPARLRVCMASVRRGHPSRL